MQCNRSRKWQGGGSCLQLGVIMFSFFVAFKFFREDQENKQQPTRSKAGSCLIIIKGVVPAQPSLLQSCTEAAGEEQIPDRGGEF